MNMEQQLRFALGIGAILLPIAAYLVIEPNTDAVLKALPMATRVAVMATGIGLVFASIACWITGLVNWD